MPIRVWRPFDLLVDDGKHDRSGLSGLTVRLLDSPVGGYDAVGRKLPLKRKRELSAALHRLANRDIDQAGVIDLGETLADLILPGGIRDLLVRSLERLGEDEGLRIGLHVDPELADIPWEYTWVARQRGQRDSTGFVALDPDVSLVRYETAQGGVATTPLETRDRRVVALLADPESPTTQRLDLAVERRNLETALEGIPGVTCDVRENATIADLFEAMADGADVFHFAGHGEADRLFLVDARKRPWPLPAEQLALNLRGRGVQLVVVGACETAARDRAERWTGVATRLIAEGLPAVIAMQYLVDDGMAIAFSKRLYQSLAVGWSLDEAVGAGRLAMYNYATGGYNGSGSEWIWPDWGVPVLYGHPNVTVALASVKEQGVRDRLEEETVQTARLRTTAVEAGGRIVGAVGASGVIDVQIKTGNVAGEVVGSRDFRGTKADIEIDAKNVQKGGLIIGIADDSKDPSGDPSGRKERP